MQLDRRYNYFMLGNGGFGVLEHQFTKTAFAFLSECRIWRRKLIRENAISEEMHIGTINASLGAINESMVYLTHVAFLLFTKKDVICSCNLSENSKFPDQNAKREVPQRLFAVTVWDLWTETEYPGYYGILHKKKRSRRKPAAIPR